MTRLRFAFLLATLAVSAAVCACDASDAQTADASVDMARADREEQRDMFVPECDADEQCDDGIECTNNLCESGRCVFRNDNAVCDDGVFCNGAEVCDFSLGCVAGPVQTCDDDDVCTIDRCIEDSKSCEHAARDLDEDGEADWHCAGGTDCDDRDPARSSTSNEVCDDFIDNDCDDMVDEPDCGRALYDLCDAPFAVSASGSYVLTSDGARPDYRNSCAAEGYRDIVVQLDIAELSDLTVIAAGDSFVGVGLRTVCGDAPSERDCNLGQPAQVRARSVAPGTYYLIVATPGATEVLLDVALSAPTAPATNETCASALALPDDGRVLGSFVDVADDVTTACGYDAAPELVYAFTLEEEKDVRVIALSPSGDQLTASIQDDCDGSAVPRRCTGGAAVDMTAHRLPAGSYFIVLEGPSYREVDFELRVELSEPTDAVAGDVCESAIALTSGEPLADSLSGAEDDVRLNCSSFLRDKIYSFTLTDRADVSVTVESSSYVVSSIRSTCSAAVASELRCAGASPIRHRLNDLTAGTYYVVVEAFGASGYTITQETLPPTTPVAVAANDVCASAYAIPEAGGVFSGSTAGMLNNYGGSCGADASSPDAVFSLSLSAPKRVRAWLTGASFDAVLTVQAGTCAGFTELACDDDSGGGSMAFVDLMLGAGTFYFVVDGFGLGSSGAYVLEVATSDS